LCAFDKLTGRVFSEDDCTTAGTIAAQVAVAYDNARRREDLEQEIARRIEATDKLKAMSVKNEVLEEFATVAAHDLTSPLATVHCSLELVTERCAGKVDGTSEMAMLSAMRGLNRMDELIRGLLEYSRAGGHIEGSSVACDDLVNECLANLDADIKACGAEISWGILPVVRGDHGRLLQLFQNLISNAIKYRDRRGRVTPKVHLRAEQQPQEWVFSVHDNGIGIAAEHLEEIFSCFKRLHSQSEYPGSGVGLATCKKIVESHGGQLWVDSEPGKGSTFYFTLPTADHDDLMNSMPSHEAAKEDLICQPS
jgi:light-regulated signal transduction histidine kinase (bacteriophytochrome)